MSTFCAAALPPVLAGLAAGALTLAAAVVVWRACAHRAAPEAPEVSGPAAVSDSLPPGSDARMRLLESAVVHAHDAVAILEATPTAEAGRSVLYVNDAF